MGDAPQAGLQRHFGLLQSTALNVTMVVGAGVFITIPDMLGHLPGPYALLGWLGAGALILVDGMVWGELAAAFPGSGGSYLYLLECYGRRRWGRLMAFLFIWQFLLSGPLELASGLIAVALFANGLSPELMAWNKDWTWTCNLYPEEKLVLTVSPVQVAIALLAAGLLALLYRRITGLGKLTVTFWVGVLGVCAWILLDGFLHFDPGRALSTAGAPFPAGFAGQLGAAMILAIYSYLGYYNVCYIGDEVRDPARTIPRAVLLSALLVVLLFNGMHLAMLGTVPWSAVSGDNTPTVPADFMGRLHGPWAVRLVSALLIWSVLGSAFAGLLGYSRIPYGAARGGHFFTAFGRVHPVHHIPHVALLLVGGLTIFWSFFDLTNVINALIATRILEQFIAQNVGLMLWRRRHPDRPPPWKMVLYPLPCLLALAGWLFVYCSAPKLSIVLGLATLLTGVAAFFLWSWWTGAWPFGPAAAEEVTPPPA